MADRVTTDRDTDLVIVTPWYPTEASPYAGSFVRDNVLALSERHPRPLIVHLDNRPPEESAAPRRECRPEGEVLRIPVPMDPFTSRADMARAQRDALARAMPEELARAGVVHVHVGMPTGWAVASLLPPATRLVVTEHATYLQRIFVDDDARRLYGQMLARSDVLLPVGRRLEHSIRTAFPQFRDRIRALPNPVGIERIPMRPELPKSLSSWLYVGNFIERKGVDRLVDAFAAYAGRRGGPRAQLTLVGQGPLRADLQIRAEVLGIADRIRILPPVAPDDVGKLFADADVLVHLSSFETFGMTLVEAAAAGLPVVVTDCGEPRETLAVAEALGMARFVALPPETEAVLSAVADLENALPTARPDISRRVLARRYAPAEIARRLEDVYAGRRSEASDEFGLRALGVAFSASSLPEVWRTLQFVADTGGQAVLLTTAPTRLPRSDPRIRVIDVSRYERRITGIQLERFAVLQLPALGLRAVRRGLVVIGRSAPPAGRRAVAAAVRAIDRTREAHRRGADRFHRGPYQRGIRHYVPWLLARYAERGPLAVLDVAGFDLLVAPDFRATPLAWRLARRHPRLAVRTPMSRPQVLRFLAAMLAGTEPERDAGTVGADRQDADR
jgi:glycogen(starch) synthase